MVRTSIIPKRLERNLSDENIPVTAGKILQRVTLSRQVGRVIRGFGTIPSQRQVTTSTITEAGGFRTPDGNYAVIDVNGGNIQVTRPDTLLGTGPAGILPLWADGSAAGGNADNCNKNGCCDGHCVDCLCAPGAFDLDVAVGVAPFCASAVQNLAGTKNCKPCIKACPDCGNKVDAGAKVSFRVVNTSGKCIAVQFYVTIAGLPANCRVGTRYGCGASSPLNNGAGMEWFYVCLGGFESVTGCMDNVVQTANGGCCDGQTAGCCAAAGVSLGGFKYQVHCHGGLCNVPGCAGTLVGCPNC